MKTIYPVRVLCHLERCCFHVIATQIGERFVLSIDGGRFDGVSIQCVSEESVVRLFDATRDMLLSGAEPWWLQELEAT